MTLYDVDASHARLARISEAIAAQVAHIGALPEGNRERACQNLALLRDMHLIAEKTHRLVLAAAIPENDPYLIGAKFWPADPSQPASEPSPSAP